MKFDPKTYKNHEVCLMKKRMEFIILYSSVDVGLIDYS